VQSYESDPANIPRIRSSLNEASKDIILLVEVRTKQQHHHHHHHHHHHQYHHHQFQVLAFLEESMRSMGPNVELRYQPHFPAATKRCSFFILTSQKGREVKEAGAGSCTHSKHVILAFK
jgi:hypothetical protein